MAVFRLLGPPFGPSSIIHRDSIMRERTTIVGKCPSQPPRPVRHLDLEHRFARGHFTSSHSRAPPASASTVSALKHMDRPGQRQHLPASRRQGQTCSVRSSVDPAGRSACTKPRARVGPFTRTNECDICIKKKSIALDMGRASRDCPSPLLARYPSFFH